MRYYCPECREFLEESGTILDVEHVPSEHFGACAVSAFHFRVCACCGEEVDDAPEPEIEEDDEACCANDERDYTGGNCANCGYPYREE